MPSVSPIFPQLNYRGNYFGLFVQDDWRINSRLTLNAGLRWDYESPVVEELNQQNIGFDMTSPSPFQVPGLSLTGGLLFASDDQRMPFKKDLNNIQPRAGATFRVDDQTVMRGGYALAYLPTFDNGYNNGFSVTTTLVASTDGGITPTGRLSNPFPAGLDQPVGNSQGLSTLVGRGFTFSDPERTIPYVHQFSVGVQRELPGRLALDLSYVGSRTQRPAGVEGDQRDHRRAARDRQRHAPAGPQPVPGPPAGDAVQRRHGAAAAARASLPAVRLHHRGSPAVRRQRLRRAADQRQQAHVERAAVPRELHLLADGRRGDLPEPAGRLGSADARRHRADSPHRLLVSSTYALPFFKDQKGVIGSLLGGWQMNGIVTFQSGLPVATTAGAFLVGDPTIENPTLARWFNTCTQALSGARQNCASADEAIAWQVQPPFTLRTLTTRLEDVRTERPDLIDFSLFKTFSLPQRMRIQLRLESFNLFNTPWFGAPNTNVTNAAFGTVAPTQANDPRNVQIGIRFMF